MLGHVDGIREAWNRNLFPLIAEGNLACAINWADGTAISPWKIDERYGCRAWHTLLLCPQIGKFFWGGCSSKGGIWNEVILYFCISPFGFCCVLFADLPISGITCCSLSSVLTKFIITHLPFNKGKKHKWNRIDTRPHLIFNLIDLPFLSCSFRLVRWYSSYIIDYHFLQALSLARNALSIESSPQQLYMTSPLGTEILEVRC